MSRQHRRGLGRFGLVFVAAAGAATVIGSFVVSAHVDGIDAPAPPQPADVRDFNDRQTWGRYSSADPADGLYAVGSEAQAIVDMIAHHRDAIDAASKFVPYSSGSDTAGFAERIVRIQSAEVEQLEAFLADWYPGVRPETSWEPMFCTIESTSDEASFLSMMIDHHREAVAMYRQWVADGVIVHDEFGLMVRRVGRAQAGEIVTMQQFLGFDRPHA